MDDPIDPYALVQSLYGPGTVTAWLLTLTSVFLTWTLNRHSRSKDTISLDFIAVLLFPVVASAHFMYRMTQLTVPMAQLITSKHRADVQEMAALEAPLNICETFSIAALILVIPHFNGEMKWRRFLAVLVVGLVSWATENLLYASATAKGVEVSQATLSRPYAFLFMPIIAGSWTFLAICITVALGIWVLVPIIRSRRSEPPQNTTHAFRLNTICGRTGAEAELAYRETILFQRHERLARELSREAMAMRTLPVLTLFFLPMTFASTFFSMSFETNATYWTPKVPRKPSRFMFLPNSNVSIWELDQAVALTTGVIILLHAIWSAYKSRGTDAPQEERTIVRRNSI
ncbi:hypothetical protein BU23DRAFT_499607 [Bimuria novae-zelandiae CBS 107.79]|uniref:Uncharacterized protein n=1 Tax=Bimuria novae-zelandiae CBS 107.79 TaxID=1447943 RepID=A0A6A5VX33_9PLEO|nr:hypothetical protein BU23DRAFT_499607 [Bimuria novae-zelandiae CBS 107.79]